MAEQAKENRIGDVELAGLTLPNFESEFEFKIPKTYRDENPGAPEKAKSSFQYPKVTNREQAEAVMAYKEWTLEDMVNENLKVSARSNAYQSALLPFKPSEVHPDVIKARMIRDFIRQGINEDVARKIVDNALAGKFNTETAE